MRTSQGRSTARIVSLILGVAFLTANLVQKDLDIHLLPGDVTVSRLE